MITIRALWAYRGFILGSVQREFQSKYRNSLLGSAWNVINPMIMIVVYTLIFANLMRARLAGVDSVFAYSIYICAGIITWGYFTDITSRAIGVFLEYANLLKKLNFPRMCLPVIVVANATLNFGIVLLIFLSFLLITGNFKGWVTLAILPVLVVQVIFAIGLGISLAVLNVFFRDVGQFFGVFVTLWFWLTPIVYPVNVLPHALQNAMRFNPMAGLTHSYQQIFVYGHMPDWYSLAPTLLLGVILCLYGLWQFRRHVGEMVDEL